MNQGCLPHSPHLRGLRTPILDPTTRHGPLDRFDLEEAGCLPGTFPTPTRCDHRGLHRRRRHRGTRDGLPAPSRWAKGDGAGGGLDRGRRDLAHHGPSRERSRRPLLRDRTGPRNGRRAARVRKPRHGDPVVPEDGTGRRDRLRFHAGRRVPVPATGWRSGDPRRGARRHAPDRLRGRGDGAESSVHELRHGRVPSLSATGPDRAAGVPPWARHRCRAHGRCHPRRHARQRFSRSIRS